MGLTHQSCGFRAHKRTSDNETLVKDYEIALAGNPNTGKSTIFNALTGLNQHTGNWPGKTVLRAEGRFRHKDMSFKLVDLPGTYSLLANSVEEQVARDYLCFQKPAATVVVVDATCLERNLNLVLQIIEITSQVIVCVNLIDEAERKSIHINTSLLSEELGVPVVATAARKGIGLEQLTNTIADLAKGLIKTNPRCVIYNDEIETAIKQIEPLIKQLVGGEFNSRWLAIKFLDRDQTVIDALKDYLTQKNNTKVKIGGISSYEPVLLHSSGYNFKRS